MRNIRMTIGYEGTRYAGWQIQPGAPTIQGVLEDRLTRILQEPVRLAGAGRTDAGVHALGQVANFSTECRIPLAGLRSGLNARLPEDIRILETAEAEPGFHARSWARGKEYRYTMVRAEVVSPFEAPRVMLLHGALDVPAMADAATRFEGRHDFTSFCPAATELDDKTRRIFTSRIEEDGDRLTYVVRGEGFLRHMVRTIVGTLVAVGRRRIGAADIASILAARDRRSAGPCAPARGLTLMRVEYDGERA